MKGQHLLLIHGFPHDSRVWAPQIGALGEHLEVLAPDLRGFGKDDREITDVITMERYATDLKDLLDHHNIPKITVCGLSMGGYIAMAFIDLFPDRVDGSILCNTKASADSEEAREGRQKVAQQAFEQGVPVIARAMLPKMLTSRTREQQPEIAAKIEQMMASQDPAAVAAAAKGMALRPDRRQWLKGLALRTTVITGDSDPLMELSTSVEMHEAVANSKLVVIQGAAHLSNIDQPVEFNKAVFAHFGR